MINLLSELNFGGFLRVAASDSVGYKRSEVYGSVECK